MVSESDKRNSGRQNLLKMRGRPLDHVIYVMDHTIVDDVQVFTLYGLLKHDEAIFGERDDRRQQVLGG
jgi:hypothetical protein